jgi:hypothetical protein
MKQIIVRKSVSIRKVSSKSACCSWCGRILGEGTVACSINNHHQNVTMNKNIWIHLGCISDFNQEMNEVIADNAESISAMAV